MKVLDIALGAVAGLAAGFAAGILLAPRSGAESRAMASDAINDAWDSAVDTYERGQQAVNETIAGVRPDADATTDELRAKVDLARERMDQLRDSLTAAEVQSEVVTADEAEAEDKIIIEEASAEEVAEEAAEEEVVETETEAQAEDEAE